MTWRPVCSGSGACCPGSWWSSNASRGRREPHTPSFRARTRWRRRAIFGSAGVTAQRVKGLASPDGELRKLKGARNPKDGRWLAEPTWLAVGGRGRGDCDGTVVTWLMSWSVTDSAWTSLKRDTNLTCHGGTRTCGSLLDIFGR